MRSMLKRLQTLEKHTKRCRRVIFRFHLNDGRVVDSAMNALPEPSEFADDCIFLDFCEADLYL